METWRLRAGVDFWRRFCMNRHWGTRAIALVNQIAGGWELAGVITIESGPFLTVLAQGADPSGTNFVNFDGNGRADIMPGVSVVPANQMFSTWINTAAFAIPAVNIGRFGDSPVGAITGPETEVVSLSFYRTFKLKERLTFGVGAAASNAFNHPNYGMPGLTLGTGSFGTISSLQRGRTPRDSVGRTPELLKTGANEWRSARPREKPGRSVFVLWNSYVATVPVPNPRGAPGNR